MCDSYSESGFRTPRSFPRTLHWKQKKRAGFHQNFNERAGTQTLAPDAPSWPGRGRASAVKTLIPLIPKEKICVVCVNTCTALRSVQCRCQRPTKGADRVLYIRYGLGKWT